MPKDMPLPVKKDPLWKVVLAIVLWALFVYANFFFIITASSADLYEMEPFIAFSFLITAYVYFYMRKKFPKHFAVITIIAGLVSNHYQITKLAHDPTRIDLYDRLTIIVVGVAVIGKGFKDFNDTKEKEEEDNKKEHATA